MLGNTSVGCFIVLSLCIVSVTAARKGVIDLRRDEWYLQKYQDSSINYTSCRRMGLHNDDEIEDDVCHISKLKNHSHIHLEFTAKPCCPFHGFLENSGQCKGRDKDGADVLFTRVGVCLQDDGNTTAVRRQELECPLDCRTVRGTLTEQDKKELRSNESSIWAEKRNFTDFCIALQCDNAGEFWEHGFEACGECKSAEEANMELNEAFPSLPLCCGPSGMFNIQTQRCQSGDMSGELAQKFGTCNWRNKTSVTITEITGSSLDMGSVFCIGWMKGKLGNFKGMAKCDHDCNGNNRCIQSCSAPGEAFNLDSSIKMKIPEGFNFSQVLGLGSGWSVIFGRKKGPVDQCHFTVKTVKLFPEEKCEERVDILEDGSLKTVNGDIMEYGEFCVEPLAGNMERGSYMIRTCKEKEEKNEDSGIKYKFYYIILIISIICLTATIIIYIVFRTALLQSEYNKIMLHFALCLLLAFLTLVVMQNLDIDTMTPSLCTCLTISHQFFLLSAFTMMTLMSYDIFKQIRGMSVVRLQRRSLWKHTMIAYSLPGIIALLTLIVELGAPKCADVRPKFGLKSCHFYGKLDKFVWLYLPILCLLIVNTAMFIYVARNIWINSKTAEASSGGNRMEKRDKMCLYLRLFIGMGIIWYFEIIAFSFTGSDVGVEWFYLTDTLNMLQGVWVFLIFVCKRNVIKVVTRRAESLYSSVGSKMPAVKERSRTETSRTDTTSVSVTRAEPNVSLPVEE